MPTKRRQASFYACGTKPGCTMIGTGLEKPPSSLCATGAIPFKSPGQGQSDGLLPQGLPTSDFSRPAPQFDTSLYYRELPTYPMEGQCPII